VPQRVRPVGNHLHSSIDGLAVFAVAEIPVLAHERKYDGTTGTGAIWMALRIVIARPLNQAGEQRSLGIVKARQLLPEVSPRTLADASHAVRAPAPHVRLVRVVFEDLMLG